ncbi:S8 family serine peptidase [Rhizobium leguminosarum]|uniref:S8 family serine peptidase n=1 Tax=Rhizobium leguminosarum TaxID=384 RepID=A0ACD5EYE1_RHILE|nr:S8 family serine peptidase [Rhizobium leguminosarum]
MVDIGLRIFIVIIFSMTIAISGKVIFWTITPWVEYIIGSSNPSRVSVAPITLIEGGKIQSAQSSPIAAQLSFRLNTIMLSLSKNLSKEYGLVKQNLNVSFPEATAKSNVNFDAFIDDPIKFDAKVFDIDIVGIGNFFYSQLDKHDNINVFLEISATRSRYFGEITRDAAPGARIGGEVSGDVQTAIDQIACDISYEFLADNKSLAGMAKEEFCPFSNALEEFQRFIVDAAAADRKEQISPTRLNDLLETFKRPPLSTSKAALVHMLAAGLYRLNGNLDAAVDRLKQAAALAPSHPFVQQNLDHWLNERAELSQPRPTISVTDQDVAKAYEAIRNQKALESISWMKMWNAARALPAKKQVTVAILSTGYNKIPIPTDIGGEILPVEVTALGSTPDDVNGHGDSVTNLLAALTPDSAVKILPIKALGDSGSEPLDSIARGVSKAIEAGTDVLILPLGAHVEIPNLRSVLDKARERGIIIVAAAGNEPDNISFPASLPTVISAGAVDSDGSIAIFSPSSPGVTVFVPGIRITVFVRGKLEQQSGTSFTATIAGAAIATALSRAGPLSQDAIRKAITETSKRLKTDGPLVLQADEFLQTIMK